MKNAFAVALVAFALAAPVRAQDEEKPATKKVESRNDTLKRVFKDVAAKGASFVVKVGSGGFGVILPGKLIATTETAVKGSTVHVTGPAGSGDAKVLGVDQKNAIALLECPFDAKAIELSKDEPRIGQYAIAVGTDEGALAAGVVSAKNRKVEPKDLSQGNILMGFLSDGIDGPKRTYPKVLQHDAPMTDESLGSALVDSKGLLLGMNVGTGYRGSSYAIATADLLALVDAIKSGKTDEKPKAPGKPWLGASVKEGDDGSLVVVELAADGPAEKAGLKVGDRVYKLDGQNVTTLDQLAERISAKKPGDEITLSLLRNGEELKLKVKLGEK